MRAGDRLEYTDPSRGSDYRDISSGSLETDARPEPMTVERLHELYDDVTKLTREQVAELSILIKAGVAAQDQLGNDETVFDPDLAEASQVGAFAREKLVLANLGLVRMVVSKRMNMNAGLADYDDLSQEGYITLDKLTHSFDPTKGYSFSTFAVKALTHSMISTSWNLRRGIRVDGHVQQEGSMINRSKAQLADVLHREPTIAELAAYTNLSEKRIKDVYQYLEPVASLDLPLSTEGEGDSTLIDAIAESVHEKVDDTASQMVGRNDLGVAKLIEFLPPKHQHIMRGLYGLDGIVKSPEELAEEMGIGRESVKRSYERAKARIRALAYMDDAGNLVVSDDRDTPIAS